MAQVRLTPPQDWPTLGLEVAAWIETYLRHDAGEYQGTPVELTNEQLVFLMDAYRVFPPGYEGRGKGENPGDRVVRRGVLSRPKGSAKSSLAKLLVVAEARGPVHFGGWDADGNPVGVMRPNPWIRVMATEEQQSINTVFGGVVEIFKMAKDEHPEIFGEVDEGMTRIYLPGGGQIRPSTASASSKDGGLETFIVIDEGHLWKSNELKEAYRTVRRNLVKRGGWIMECSTMFAPGEQSVQEEAWEYAQKQLEHRTDLRFLWDHREGPDVADLWDDDELLAALHESYGDAVSWVPMVEVMAEMRDPECDVAEQCRYFLNQRRAGDGRCVDPVVWDGAFRVDMVLDGPIGLGFDGSLMRADGDSTILTACTLEEPRRLTVIGEWVQPEEECWEEVDATVFAAFKTWDVALMYCDRARWGPRVDAWANRYPKKVKAWPATSIRRVAQGFKDFGDALASDRLVHDAGKGSLLRSHALNAVKRKEKVLDSDGKPMWTAVKDSRSSSRLIDGYYSAMLAHTAACEAHAAGYRARRATLVSW